VLLDLMLPGLSGTEVCRQIRSKVERADHHGDRARLGDRQGRRAGRSRDDYVTKPYSPRELVARIRAVLRRRSEPEELKPAALEAGPVRMDVDRHTVSVDGDSVRCRSRNSSCWRCCCGNAGRVLTRGQLIDRIWGADYVGDTKTLDVHVKRLRAKIEPEPGKTRSSCDRTGLGYKFEP